MLSLFAGTWGMQIARPHSMLTPWCRKIFEAHAARTGGIVRRSVRDVEREIGRRQLEAEVRRRGFHMVECGGQFIIICNSGQMNVLC